MDFMFNIIGMMIALLLLSLFISLFLGTVHLILSAIVAVFEWITDGFRNLFHRREV